MSKMTVAVAGTAKFYALGMFEDAEVVTDEALTVQLDMVSQKAGDLSAIGDALKALAKRDVSAPAFGSASSFKTGKAEATLTLTCEDGIMLVRLYHAQASEFNEEVSAGKYLDLECNPTDEPWTKKLMLKGDTVTVPVIESNAITVAIYG